MRTAQEVSWSGADYVPATGVDGVLRLRTALGRRGPLQALREGLPTPGWEFDFHDIKPLPLAFRMMVNDRSFHVAEMALATLAMAIDHGRPLIGLPAVLNRDFHYRSIVVRADSAIEEPADLAGRRVGVRAYSQTTGVWVRGLLDAEYGVAPDQISWVTLESAHVAEYVDPPHVERATHGSNLVAMLAAGDIDAAVIMDPRVEPAVARPLFPHPVDLAQRAYDRTGIFPVNHVVALDTALVAEHPEIADQVYALLLKSRDIYARRLHDGGAQTPEDHHALELATITGGDFNPYGLDRNRSSCAQLFRHAYTQGLLSRPLGVDDVFLQPRSG